MFCSSCSLGIHHLHVLQDLCSRCFTLEVFLPPLQLLEGLGSTVCKNAFHLQVSAVYAQGNLEGIGFYFKTLFGSNKNSRLSFSNKKISLVKGITLGFHYFSFFNIQYFTVKMLFLFKCHVPRTGNSIHSYGHLQHTPLALLCLVWATVRGGKGKKQAWFLRSGWNFFL